MTRKPPSNPKECVDLLLRRKWWIIAPLLVIPVLTFLVSLRLPKMYQSQTVILVEPQKVSSAYVQATVTTDATDRLQTISEEVMSRTRLQHIVRELGLYKALSGKVSEQEIISAMRKDITVDIIRGTTDRSPIGGFKISYSASTPVIAQKVTQEIANLFIEENLKARDQQALGTSQFIEDQLAKAKADLDVQEQKIKEFKAAHLGALPEQEGSNLSLIGQYQTLAQQNSDAIDRADQQKVYLQSMLNISAGDKPGVMKAPVTALEITLQKKEDELAAAKQKYTDSHPDVIRLTNEVASLQQQLKTQPKDKPMMVSASGPNIAQQLQSQLMSIQQEIKQRTARQLELEGKIRALQGRVEVLPAVQGQFADLNRDYQSMEKNYQTLLEKQQNSSMATELERHDEGEQFRILDPASLPTAPASPNLLMINAGGFAVALMIGLGLAVVMDLRDGTIHNPDELPKYLDLPLIVAIPAIPGMTRKSPQLLKA
jgi:polysaccharide chain length determinant protein (PEP-CTERM system associated)